MTKQATQRSYDGRLLKRWYLFTADGRRLITWAENRRQAGRKRANDHTRIVRVEPAPAMLDSME